MDRLRLGIWRWSIGSNVRSVQTEIFSLARDKRAEDREEKGFNIEAWAISIRLLTLVADWKRTRVHCCGEKKKCTSNPGRSAQMHHPLALLYMYGKLDDCQLETAGGTEEDVTNALKLLVKDGHEESFYPGNVRKVTALEKTWSRALLIVSGYGVFEEEPKIKKKKKKKKPPSFAPQKPPHKKKKKKKGFKPSRLDSFVFVTKCDSGSETSKQEAKICLQIMRI